MSTLSAFPAGGIATARNGNPKLQRTFVLRNRNGLHARPCALLISTLRPFQCEIEVQVNDQSANGGSILGLMALAAGYGSKMTFSIAGEQAAEAMAAVKHLFDTSFMEAYT